MKAIILTSSIFYLLGLKLSTQVELNQKSLNDSLQTSTKQEIIIPKQETQELPDLKIEKEETPVNCGSNEETAPWNPQSENIKNNKLK